MNLAHVGFHWYKHKEKTICLGFQKVFNCHGWNLALEKPTTHKCWDDTSRGNLDMDAIPEVNTNFCSAAPVLSLILAVGGSPNIKKLFFFNYQYEMMKYYQYQKLQHF